MEFSATNPGKILIVDDNAESAKTMGWAMEMLGQEVRTALTASAAVPLALSFLPDIILLDINLPGMNGYELCRMLRREPALKDAVFVAQTGWDREEHRQQSRAAGFDHHLVKPIDIQTLRQLLVAPKKAA